MLFADDALLYGVISNEEDGDKLEDDLRQLEMWQSKWQMVFNPSKCKTICISTKKVPPQRKYVFCGIKLEQLECISCLGVLLNEDLKWSKRVNTTAYTAVDCPKLEYVCADWDLYQLIPPKGRCFA